MARSIYRQAALDRLAAHDPLDRAAKTVRVRDFAAYLILVGLILGGVLWGMNATAPIKVRADGIVLQESGLLEIVANGEGRVKRLNLDIGTLVTEGDIVAEFEKPNTERELSRLKAELVDSRARLKTLRAFYIEADRREFQVESNRLAAIFATQTLVERREFLLGERLADLTQMEKKKIITRNKLIDAELEVANAKEKTANLKLEAKIIETKRVNRQSKQGLALLDEELKLNNLARKVTRMEGQLADESVARSLHSGRVVELKVNRGDVVTAGASLAVLVPEEQAIEPDFGVLYVSPVDGKRIKVGMDVELVPSSVRREQYGFVRGTVEFVSAVPSTQESMNRVLKNQQLVTRLSGAGAPFEVKVGFVKNSTNPSGLEWSSSTGPPSKLSSGTLFKGDVVVERVPLLALLAPSIASSTSLSELDSNQANSWLRSARTWLAAAFQPSENRTSNTQ